MWRVYKSMSFDHNRCMVSNYLTDRRTIFRKPEAWKKFIQKLSKQWISWIKISAGPWGKGKGWHWLNSSFERAGISSITIINYCSAVMCCNYPADKVLTQIISLNIQTLLHKIKHRWYTVKTQRCNLFIFLSLC